MKVDKSKWEHVPLAYFLKEHSVKNRDLELNNVFSVTNSKGFVRAEEYFDNTVQSSNLSTYKIVEKGMFAYNPSRINVGSIALLDAEDKVIVSPLYVIFSIIGDLNPHYLLRFLKSDIGIALIRSNTSGSVRESLRFKELTRIFIPVPSLNVQKSIAEELDVVQDIIRGYAKKIEDLDTLARSIFLDLFGDPISNPKGWPITTIGEECMLKSGDSSANNFPKGLTPYVKVADMNLPENQFMITTSSRFVDCSQKPKGVFPRGTVIFPKRGGAITTGKLAIASQPIICDLNIMGVIPNASVHSIYLYFCFKNVDFSELFDGTTVPQINNTDIAPLKINFPPLALQQQFAEKVEAIEKQKAWVREQLADAEMLMKERMQYYFN